MSVFSNGLMTGNAVQNVIGSNLTYSDPEYYNITDISQLSDIFSVRWGIDGNQGRDFIAGPQAATTSLTRLKVYYPSAPEFPSSNDILFLVLKGYTYGTGDLEFSPSEILNPGHGWTRLGDTLRNVQAQAGTPGNRRSEVLEVYYRNVDVATSGYVTINTSWINGGSPGLGWFSWSGQIFGYRNKTIEGFDTLLGSDIETVIDNDWFTGSCDDSEIGSPGEPTFFGNVRYDPWTGSDNNFNSLIVHIGAACGVSISNWQYSTPNGFNKKLTSSGSPSVIVGDKFYSPYSIYNTIEGDTDLPGLYTGNNNQQWMGKTFAINGFHSAKRFNAAGVCSMSGIIKFTPSSLAFPETANISIYKNGNEVVRFDLLTSYDGATDYNETYPLQANPEFLGGGDSFMWGDNESVGLNVIQGDYIQITARSAKNNDETFATLIIRGFPMQYETIMSTDLRDSGGHRMDVLRMQDFGTNYPLGGLVITPADFNMTEIKYMLIQAGTAYAETAQDVAVLASQQTASAYVDPVTGATYWKINVFVPDPETGLPVELPEGAPLEFPEGLTPTIMVVGA